MTNIVEKIAEILKRGDGRYLIMGMVQAHGLGLRSLADSVNVPVEALATIEIEGFGKVPHKSLVRKLAEWIEERNLDPEDLVKAGRARFELEYFESEALEKIEDDELRAEIERKSPTGLDLSILLRVAEALS
ncbi:hypothetical protein [Methanopyrus sp. KOL6]|uniref:hypothetical protein n=1 Tax=Methanopyrus sp. KOL6 TaxID=1937004 RepID=UPI000B4BA300|nr:hypothetical protein [Methanopyrus sp. KOL6]